MRYESTSLTPKEYFQQRLITSSIYGETSASSLAENTASSSTDFVLVEYPGVVKNVDKALQTLGGVSAVAMATVSTRQLELHFQPNNVYQSGIVAEKKTVDEVISGQIRLIVRIRKYKSKTNDNSSNRIKDVECLGLVSTVFLFKSMCDFHYLPIRKHCENQKYLEDLVPRLIPTTFTSALTWWEKTSSMEAQTLRSLTPYFLPPSIFSRYNTPNSKIMCSISTLGTTSSNNETNGAGEAFSSENGSPRKSVGHAKNLRSERKSSTVTVHGNEAFPLAPSEVALKDVALRIKLDRPHQMLTEMFKERPLWTRVAMLQKTELDENVLKVILAKYAFYISSGPWGRCWCRFGYDPRQDPNSKQYQTVMVSFRDHKNIPERKRLKLSVGGTGMPSVFNKLLDYAYRPGVLPPVRQMWYCVCDVYLPAAQKVLRKDFFAVLKQCHGTHGWLPPEIINSIRAAIKDDVKRVSHMLEISDDIGDGITTTDSTLPITQNDGTVNSLRNYEDDEYSDNETTADNSE